MSHDLLNGLSSNKQHQTFNIQPSIMPKATSSSATDAIISLLHQGYSVREISATTGVHYSTVSRICSQHCSTLEKPSPGCPSIITPTDVRHAMRLIGSGKAENAVEVTLSLRDMKNIPISSKTVHRHLRQAGMKAVVKQKQPLLSKCHRQNRLDFALSHQDWTVEDWKKVIWSDGRKWVWKKPGEGLSDRLVEGTLKFGGGSLMIWGCMTWEGVGLACKIDGKMDANLYTEILEDELQGTLQYYGKTPQDVIFQQDNDPKHTSRKAKQWFEDHEFEVMGWPAQSPDLNPIEHLWVILKSKLASYPTPPKGIHELWERVQKEWEEISVSTCQRLIESMPRRVQEVKKAKGGYTTY